jgi:hypothetical protein
MKANARQGFSISAVTYLSKMGIALVMLAILNGGCGAGGEPDLRRFTPTATTARKSLEQALTAWQRGEPSAQKGAGSRVVQFVDSTRRPGQTLVSYEILSELTGETPKRFAVRLKLENPTQELETRYVVVGQDPIWVFHEDDFARNQGM